MLAALISLPTPAYADDGPRVPTGRWVVDFADHQCVASRNYGDAKHPLFLAFKPSPVGEVMQVAIIQKSYASRDPAQIPVQIQIDDQKAMPLSMLAVGGKDGGMASFRINLPIAAFAPFRKAKRFSISGNYKVNGSFQLIQMQAMMKAMDRCVEDLRLYWNIEPAAQARLRSRAKANIVSLFSSDDYPGVSVQNDESGMVAFALLVDEMGKVADCTVTATSNLAALDAQACAILLERGKFEPAIGADGKPAKDAVLSRLRWEMPK